VTGKLIKECGAEFIGTFALVFFGCGSMILHELNPDVISPDSIPIIFGGIIAVMIYALGHISGAHFNPAVSIAFYSVGLVDIKKVMLFIPSQILGAVLASLAHCFFFGNSHGFGMTINKLSFVGGSSFEVLMSFFLMLTIMGVATDSRAIKSMVGIAIGSVVAICSFVGGPFTGASMNPARSLGPAFLSGDFSNIIIYIIMPVLGTISGSIFYNYIKGDV
tara:strand:- start:71 stop:730 length:660 start_codon:yes stop_codon:yes gene_type:complete